jgi:hypothetical protein
LLIAARDSLICRSSWLLGYKGFYLSAIQKNLAGDPKYLEPSFLDESRDGLPRNAADASGVGLRDPIVPVLEIG